MDNYFDSEKLQETLIELHRSQQRERKLKEENTAILEGIAAMAGANTKLEIFDSLLEVIRHYVQFETAIVLSRESGYQSFKELVATQSTFSDCYWQDAGIFKRALAGESIALFDPLKVAEFNQLPSNYHRFFRSALLTGVKVSSGDAILVFTHSLPNAFTGRCRQVIDRFRPLLERTIIDIDYRERLQSLVAARTQELIESRLRFKDFARTAGDWFWEVNTHWTFTYLSTPSVETPKINELRIFDIISGIEYQTALKTQFEEGVAFHDFECQLTQDDECRWYALSGKPYFDKDGNFLGYRGTAKDITSRRQHLADLTEARKQAELANNAKSQFLAMMSHEIRTPLNAVMGLMDTLVESGLNKEQQTWVKQMDHSAQLLLNIINDVLDLSKIETGKIDVFIEPLPLHDNLNLVFEQLAPQAHKKALNYQLSIDSELPKWIHSDSSRLSQILFNLIGNAIKFTEHGDVTVSAQWQHDQLTIEVIDTGIGIEPDAQKQLFTPFVQADGSITRKYGGTGLGLTISQLLVNKLGGHIRFTSTVGKGTTFVLELPAPVASEQAESSTATTHNNTAPLHLLVVEDSKANQMIAKLMLEKAGHSVDIADNGQIAVDMALQEKTMYDIILMDVSMPVMDGFEATRILRAAGLSTPIIATTANVMEADRQACVDAGMTDFLAKPIRAKAMRAMLQSYTKSQTEFQNFAEYVTITR
uniref:PAS domain-containing sensor histidine kinase n=1 Tax=Thaumasiovibrio occultus TaxID=1891184 RepID=UPI000B3548B8|nr:PAS domain-containing sensor histidine kinase [Thaumasiovibrio occultus]